MLTKWVVSVNIYPLVLCWCSTVVVQLICNQQVGGSNPSTSSKFHMGEFPSGQRGQTVNLLSTTSVGRIHLPPPEKSVDFVGGFFSEIRSCGTSEIAFGGEIFAWQM